MSVATSDLPVSSRSDAGGWAVIGAGSWLPLLPRPEDGGQQVTLGVRSMDLTEAQYAVQFDVQGTPIQDWQPIRLARGETWEQTVALLMLREESGVVSASLYRLDQAEEVSRRVTLRAVSEQGS